MFIFFSYPYLLLTVVQTCRRQSRSVITFFEQALQAQVHSSQFAPSLIPQP